MTAGVRNGSIDPPVIATSRSSGVAVDRDAVPLEHIGASSDVAKVEISLRLLAFRESKQLTFKWRTREERSEPGFRCRVLPIELFVG